MAGRDQYDVSGYLARPIPGLADQIRSAYEPGASTSAGGRLQVLAPGERTTDPYKPTPDELYARGKAQFDAGRLAEAADALEPLFAAYTLRDDIAKDAARMLLLINIKDYKPRKVVQYFEIVKEKAPSWSSRSTSCWSSAGPIATSASIERAYLVWRASSRPATSKTPASARRSASAARRSKGSRT